MTTDEIVAYLKKKDPRFERDWLHYEADDINAIVKYYYLDQLGWCACGLPRDAIDTIAKYLRALKSENRSFKELGYENVYDNNLLLCLAYTLDAAGFTEHGSSILYTWLTKDGEYFLYAIEAAGDDLDI